MRDSADSDDYGVIGRGRKRGRFDDADRAYVKRDRHRPRLQAEDAHDATDERENNSPTDVLRDLTHGKNSFR